MIKTLVCVFFGASFLLSADAISLSTTCQAYQSTVTGSTFCSATGSSIGGTETGTAQAASHAGYSISGNTIQATLDQHVHVGDFNGSEESYSGGSATASGSVTLSLDTPGPVRSGYLAIFATNSFGPDRYVGYSELSVDVGGLSGSCNIIDDMECNGIRPTMSAALLNMFPFTLGQDFTFTATMTSNTGCGPNDGECYMNITVPIELLFFESDGSTAVPVMDPPTDVPEPASALLLLPSLLFVWIKFRRRNSIQRLH